MPEMTGPKMDIEKEEPSKENEQNKKNEAKTDELTTKGGFKQEIVKPK